jgi:hypothetical protein
VYVVRGVFARVREDVQACDWWVAGQLELADGTRIWADTVAGGDWGAPALMLMATTSCKWRFPAPQAAEPKAFMAEIVICRSQEEAIPFRFDNMPLPTWGE